MQVADLEDISKLSPLQEEMLSEALKSPGGTSGVAQLCVELSVPLRPVAVEVAWQRVTSQNQALRTTFRAGKVPSQMVQRRTRPDFAFHEALQQEEAAALVARERARGFDPTVGPLARLLLAHSALTGPLLVLTWHPLILDQRSAARVVSQILAGTRDGTETERSRSFRDYLVWLRSQDAAAAERFWRQELAGWSAPLPLGAAEPLTGRTGHDVRTARLAPTATAALRALATAHGLSLETIAAGAWALLLARHTGQPEVLFGLETPGRTAALPGAEALVARCAQTLPLRVTVEPEASLLGWLGKLEERRLASRPFEHVPPSQVLGWSALPPDTPLFFSRLAVHPGVEAPEARDVRSIELSAEPFAVLAHPGTPGTGMVLDLVYDRSRCEDAEAAALVDGLRHLLEGAAADPGRRLAEIADRRDPTAAPGGDHGLDAILRLALQGDAAPAPAAAERRTAPAERKDFGGHEIVPVSRDQPLLATFYQEWALQLDGVDHNSIPSALHIRGALNLTALRRALTEIFCRHESMRTSFRWEAGAAYLVLAPPSEVPLPQVDLSVLSEELRTERLRRLIAANADHVFDMARGPLFIAQLARLGPQEHALLLNIHHLISDGWSIQVLHRELLSLYAAFSQGRPSPLPPLAIQLPDFAYWQRRIFAGEALAAQLSWWREALANLPSPPGLPNDRPRPETVGTRSVDLAAEVPAEPSQALRTLAHETQASIPMVLVAGINALLNAYSGEEDLLLSLIFAARNRPELSSQIGLFMNTVPLRVNLQGQPTFRQLTARVRDATIDAYSHQDVPFPRLLTELFPGRKLTRTILTGVCFNMLSFAPPSNQGQGQGLPGGLTVQMLGLEEVGAKHDLTVTCTDTGSALHFELTGAADLFSAERLAVMARDFEALLVHVAFHPDTPLQELRSVVTPL